MFKLSVVICLMGLPLSSVFAITSQDAENTEQIEVLTIKGQKPIGYFREQMELAEDSFYGLYNSLTLNDSYKITCSDETNSFSKVRKRICEPNYVSELKYDQVQSAIKLGSIRDGAVTNVNKKTSTSALDVAIQKKRKGHLKDVKKHLLANPELQQKLVLLNQTRAEYDQKRAKAYGKKWVKPVNEELAKN